MAGQNVPGGDFNRGAAGCALGRARSRLGSGGLHSGSGDSDEKEGSNEGDHDGSLVLQGRA